MNKLNYLYQFFLYYVAWILAILMAAKDHGWLGCGLALLCVLAQLLWQVCVIKKNAGLLKLTFILTLLGFVTDSLLLNTGLIFFNDNAFLPYFAPPWMIVIWLSFSIFAYSSMRAYFNRYITMGLLAFPGFVFSYACGVRLGAAVFPHGYITCILIGTIWVFLLPLSLYLYQRASS